jgi:hypothetical protein
MLPRYTTLRDDENHETPSGEYTHRMSYGVRNKPIDVYSCVLKAGQKLRAKVNVDRTLRRYKLRDPEEVRSAGISGIELAQSKAQGYDICRLDDL